MKVFSPKESTPAQQQYAELSLTSSTFMDGPAGAGKTTTGILSILKLIEGGVSPGSILVITPQRRLGQRYLDQIAPNSRESDLPEVITLAGLARRMVDLFWPLIVDVVGFQKTAPPRFLTLETAQYHMARIVGPYLDEGYFESLSLDRYRLYRQILDNLNKAALVGFPISEIGDRLSEAWVGPEEQTGIFAQAQHCAELFRAACVEQNLIDFSLQYELFFSNIEQTPEFREFFLARYKHMIADNVEEETPRGHDFFRRWINSFETSLIISDTEGGYSRFLGADPSQLKPLKDTCDQTVRLDQSFVMSAAMQSFSNALHASIFGKSPRVPVSVQNAIQIHSSEYLPDLLTWVVAEIEVLLEGGTSPSDIAVLSPFVSDSLRFLLTEKLDDKGIPWVSHRPSRAIADEAYNRCLLTLAAVAHAGWEISPSQQAVAHSLLIAIDGLDLVRATLLATTLYRIEQGVPRLNSFDQLRPEMVERISSKVGERYESLRVWLERSRDHPEEHLDQFLGRLFGEVLSQPGFGFHNRMDAGRAAAAMIESIQKFRSVVETAGFTRSALGKEYYQLIEEGLLAARYVSPKNMGREDAVFIAPAFTYLTMDRHSDVQFWLDIGSAAWAERLYQPLTHPYVLSRGWQRGRKWTDEHEWQVRREIAATLTAGLIRRCRKKIYLCYSAYGEQGLEQKGVLLRAIQRVLSAGLAEELSTNV